MTLEKLGPFPGPKKNDTHRRTERKKKEKRRRWHQAPANGEIQMPSRAITRKNKRKRGMAGEVRGTRNVKRSQVVLDRFRSTKKVPSA